MTAADPVLEIRDLSVAFRSPAGAVQALRLGASDYLTKPLDIGRLKSILANVASVPHTAPPPVAVA